MSDFSHSRHRQALWCGQCRRLLYDFFAADSLFSLVDSWFLSVFIQYLWLISPMQCFYGPKVTWIALPYARACNIQHGNVCLTLLSYLNYVSGKLIQLLHMSTTVQENEMCAGSAKIWPFGSWWSVTLANRENCLPETLAFSVSICVQFSFRT